jgi:ABC-type multidrug transport system fused ATPase/permease subunit
MRILLRLLVLVKKYWKWLVLTYSCLLLLTAANMIIPQFIGNAIDKGLGADPAVTGDMKLLVLYGLAIIGLSLLRGLFSFGQSYFAEYAGQKVAYDLRNKLYDRIQRLSFAFHDKSQTGQLMSRATQDIEGVRFFISMVAVRIINLVLTVGVVTVILLKTNWSLTIVSFVTLPIIAFIAIRFGITMFPLWTRIQQRFAAINTALQENLSGARVVKAFSRQRLESKKFEAETLKLYEPQITNARIQAVRGPLFNVLTALSTGLVLIWGGNLVFQHKLTVGELTTFYLYLGYIVPPIRMIGPHINMTTRAIASGKRVFEIVDTESAVQEKPNALVLSNVKGNIKFNNVNFSYENTASKKTSSSILEGITLEAKSGEMIALLGATGSGKTTLVNLVPRFYDVTAGSITIDDIDIRDVTLASLRKQIGIVQQDAFLFSATIKDNIAYGAVNASEEEIIAAAKTAHLHDFIITLPDGYQTWVGERGVTLSGGQKQRLAIARTLLIDPRILILDDSTSSVDTETEFLIQQALRELMKGRTTFVIAQRLQTVKDANQIFVLDKGKIVERGNHAQLLQDSKIYRQIYELQLRAQEEALGSEVNK